MPPAGYSGTPLAKKLGIKPGSSVLARNAPANYRDLLAPLPADVRFGTRAGASTDLVHVFVTKRAELARALAGLRKTLRADATVWVSWPKKSSGIASEVTEDTVREVCRPIGWVDVKVCAVDETWSGLKLVVRKELR
jgi:hypothetical protein